MSGRNQRDDRQRWRDKFDRDEMTGDELRADALKNGFVLDDSLADDPIYSTAAASPQSA